MIYINTKYLDKNSGYYLLKLNRNQKVFQGISVINI